MVFLVAQNIGGSINSNILKIKVLNCLFYEQMTELL